MWSILVDHRWSVETLESWGTLRLVGHVGIRRRLMAVVVWEGRLLFFQRQIVIDCRSRSGDLLCRQGRHNPVISTGTHCTGRSRLDGSGEWRRNEMAVDPASEEIDLGLYSDRCLRRLWKSVMAYAESYRLEALRSAMIFNCSESLNPSHDFCQNSKYLMNRTPQGGWKLHRA